MDLANVSALIYQNAADVAIKLIGGLILWYVGRKLIDLAINIVGKSFDKGIASGKFDVTIANYLKITLRVLLIILLIIGILGYFGIQTTTFAALFAAAGVAIGMAWSGLLSNLAAGIFLVVLRPFKVGDFISAAGVTGEVRDIGIFVTAINSPDNLLMLVGNNKIFGDTITNYSANNYRRVDLKSVVAYSANIDDYKNRMIDNLRQVANVMSSPSPEVEIVEFSPAGAVMTVRAYCNNQNYWQVYFDVNKLIAKVGGDFPAPMPTQQVLMKQN